jgi:hypothetical protein
MYHKCKSDGNCNEWNWDWGAYETEEPNEREEMDHEVTPLEERDYSSVDWGIALKPQRQRGPPNKKERKYQTPMDRNLGWKQDIYSTKKLTFSRLPGLNQNLEIMEKNSLIHF